MSFSTAWSLRRTSGKRPSSLLFLFRSSPFSAPSLAIALTTDCLKFHADLPSLFSDGCRMKDSKLQYDDAIVEVTWSFARQTFQIMRIRDDKHHGNHKTVVTKILDSIRDGVEEDEVCPLTPVT